MRAVSSLKFTKLQSSFHRLRYIDQYKDQWNEGFLFLLQKNKGISVSNKYYIIYNYTFTTLG